MGVNAPMTWARIKGKPTTVGGYGITDAVTSVNGQIGSVVTTGAYAIGSFVIGRPQNNTAYGVGNQVNGSSLYATSVSASYDTENGWAVTAGQVLVNVGAWRCVSPAVGYNTYGIAGLWVRYA